MVPSQHCREREREIERERRHTPHPLPCDALHHTGLPARPLTNAGTLTIQNCELIKLFNLRYFIVVMKNRLIQLINEGTQLRMVPFTPPLSWIDRIEQRAQAWPPERYRFIDTAAVANCVTWRW
jgi:hypothetical protein